VKKMSKAFFIDTSKCIACKACQVACKQWNGLPAERTVNVGSHQNPQDLSAVTWTLVRMSEADLGPPSAGKKPGLKWLFFKDQCRHCVDPACLMSANFPGSIYKDEDTGAVIYTERSKYESFDDIMCPYNIPRQDKNTGQLFKCTMCVDRVKNGMLPACVKACPTGTMNFGDRSDMLALAKKRLGAVKAIHAGASLIDDMDEVSVFYLLVEKEELYGIVRNPIDKSAFV
jgi:formate dehydrogenase iron-sulfur subunit